MISEISGNLSAFNKKLKEIVDKEIQNKSEVLIDKTQDLFFDICKGTPIKTGHARKNWFMKVDEPDSKIISKEENEDISRSQAIREAEKDNEKAADIKFNIKENDSIYIYNNVPYIRKLEDGSSKQAPSGMVALSLAKFSREMK